MRGNTKFDIEMGMRKYVKHGIDLLTLIKKNNMIPEIIKQWDKNKHKLEDYFRNTKQSEYSNYYKEILVKIFELCINSDDLMFDLTKITVIDDGDYQGTQIFLIPKDTYHPSASDYVVTNTEYGSCSGCDTLMGISCYYEDLPTSDQVKQYMTLSLHLVQKLKWLDE